MTVVRVIAGICCESSRGVEVRCNKNNQLSQFSAVSVCASRGQAELSATMCSAALRPELLPRCNGAGKVASYFEPIKTSLFLETDMMMTAELLARLLAAAIRISNLPAVDLAELPPMEAVSAEQLSHKVCPDSPERCTMVAALFDTESYRIYLRNSLNLNDPMDNSFVVHELVHVLQFRKFGDAYFASCPKRIASEQQAYYVQNNYLGEEGIDWREGFLLRFMKCPPEEAAGADAAQQNASQDELGRDQ